MMLRIAPFLSACHPEAIRQGWQKDLNAARAGEPSMVAASNPSHNFLQGVA